MSKYNSNVPVEQRFWRNVGMQPRDACWPWRGNTTKGPAGYGSFSVNGRVEYTHRYSYELHKGPIPPGLQVMHACDNPACVNPAHLSLGTAADNARDCMHKGRNKRGRYTSDTAAAKRKRAMRARRRAGIVCLKGGPKPVYANAPEKQEGEDE